MRTLRILIATVAALLLSSAYVYAGIRCTLSFDGKRYARHQSEPTWNDVRYEAAGPAEICKSVRKRVKYSRDMYPEDEWRSGRETWQRGEGDCEDIAATVKDLCKEKDIDAKIHVFSSKTARKAHAVVIGESNGQMWMSSNGSYEYVQSLRDAKEKIARDLGWWSPEVHAYKVETSSTNKARRYVRTANDSPSIMPYLPDENRSKIVIVPIIRQHGIYAGQTTEDWL